MTRLTTGRRALLAGAASIPLAAPAVLRAQAVTLKIGVLNDQSGLYRDFSGPGSVEAVRLAIEEFQPQSKGITVEIVSGDHQNKPDVGATLARQWIDRDGVDVIVDVPTSSVALAINGIVREKDKVFLNSTAASADLTGPACTSNTIHWTYDTWMLGNGTGKAMVAAGGKSWFFITADYAFGHALERDTAAFVRSAGGEVKGAVRTPFPGTTDFSSFLLQAQASGAQVIGLANAGGDTINSIKQAAEFGITQAGQKLAGLLVFVTDVHALGLKTAQGLVLTESFYWDLNDGTRAFSEKFSAKMRGAKPSMGQAGCYSAVLHYLKAAAAAGAGEVKKSGATAVAQMKALPTQDLAFGAGTVRQDGRKLHPAYLFEVKKPSESKGPWDYYRLVTTIPAEQAFRPLNEGQCPLVRA